MKSPLDGATNKTTSGIETIKITWHGKVHQIYSANQVSRSEATLGQVCSDHCIIFLRNQSIVPKTDFLRVN